MTEIKYVIDGVTYTDHCSDEQYEEFIEELFDRGAVLRLVSWD